MKKKVLAMLLASAMVFGLTACGSSAADTAEAPAATEEAATEETAEAPAAEETAEAPAASGDLIKVGIINNDPNESGYRTANDKDLRTMSRLQQLRSSSRTALIISFSQQLIHQAGIQY